VIKYDAVTGTVLVICKCGGVMRGKKKQKEIHEFLWFSAGQC